MHAQVKCTLTYVDMFQVPHTYKKTVLQLTCYLLMKIHSYAGTCEAVYPNSAIDHYGVCILDSQQEIW